MSALKDQIGQAVDRLGDELEALAASHEVPLTYLGVAGGDHLHFTMLVGGRMVSPMEWWDPHWIDDRILRKLREAAGL